MPLYVCSYTAAPVRCFPTISPPSKVAAWSHSQRLVDESLCARSSSCMVANCKYMYMCNVSVFVTNAVAVLSSSTCYLTITYIVYNRKQACVPEQYRY